MKKLLLFNLLLFFGLFNTFTMEQPQDKPKKQEIPKALNEIDWSQLPKDMWHEIAKYGVKKDKQTEKEIFQDIDSLRLTSKTAKAGIDQLVSTVGLRIKKPNYTYLDFKNGIMQEILTNRTKQFAPLKRPTSKKQFEEYKKEIINQAVKAEAINWSKNRLSKDDNYRKNLNLELVNAKQSEFEKLLIIGADPNSTYQNKPLLKIAMIIENFDAAYKISELLFKYKADPNNDFLGSSNVLNIVEEIITKVTQLENPSKRIELLLQHGRKITINDLKAAQKALKEYEKATKTLPLVESYKRSVPELKEIVRLLKEALKKQGVYKTII